MELSATINELLSKVEVPQKHVPVAKDPIDVLFRSRSKQSQQIFKQLFSSIGTDESVNTIQKSQNYNLIEALIKAVYRAYPKGGE